MNFIDPVRLARGLFWFVVGTAFFITGVVMTIGTIIGGYDHEWYIGPLGIVVGGGAEGYPSIWKALQQPRGLLTLVHI